MKYPIAIITVIALLSTAIPVAAAPPPREVIANAREAMVRWDVEGALDSFEEALLVDRRVLAYDDFGFMPRLVERARNQADPRDPDSQFRLARYLDWNGQVDESIATLEAIIRQYPGGEIERQARSHLERQMREQEIRQRYLDRYVERERRETQRYRQRSIARSILKDQLQHSISTHRRDVARAEERLSDWREQRQRLRDMVNEMQAAGARMRESENDWHGYDKVRTWRLEPDDVPGSYIDNTFRRRYRQDREKYQRLKEGVERLRQRLGGVEQIDAREGQLEAQLFEERRQLNVKERDGREF